MPFPDHKTKKCPFPSPVPLWGGKVPAYFHHWLQGCLLALREANISEFGGIKRLRSSDSRPVHDFAYDIIEFYLALKLNWAVRCGDVSKNLLAYFGTILIIGTMKMTTAELASWQNSNA